jgi:hypothetical protein
VPTPIQTIFGQPLPGKVPRPTSGRKNDFQGDRAQLFHERLLSFARNTSEEAERQMHLPRLEPAHATQVRIQFGETLPHRFLKLDANEEAFRNHEI